MSLDLSIIAFTTFVSSALTLDAKGRMSIPSRHRDALQLQGDGRVTLTKHPDGCLLLFPRYQFEALRLALFDFAVFG